MGAHSYTLDPCCRHGPVSPHFRLQAADVGQLQRLQVVCDGSGPSPTWHLAHVTVTKTATGETAAFVFDNWLDENNGWSHMLVALGLDPEALAQVRGVACWDTHGALNVRYSLERCTKDAHHAVGNP